MARRHHGWEARYYIGFLGNAAQHSCCRIAILRYLTSAIALQLTEYVEEWQAEMSSSHYYGKNYALGHRSVIQQMFYIDIPSWNILRLEYIVT